VTYIPNADAERAQMLKALDLDSTEGLFKHLPAALRLDRIELPEPLSEVDVLVQREVDVCKAWANKRVHACITESTDI